ncbi:double-strand break repair helicase AddA [Labrys sp. LIt4]|uniref:double-strand break repair helicase AddA n=1 Tax=Labrys sp. LIt4 TaxID=2821355 RepID=UPI001AE023E1|nr:double-strand break repair helicase AddA [Labrys sp. LIt4]MBP0582442.1 double-strand break repair helicase AddA [Labrys sp. LIt4]
MIPRRPSPDTIHNQRLASDPSLSAWVSANAGSGKTTVLTRRVIRLLLAGVDPSAILCLTFTKAAAANMQNRIFAMLGQWAVEEESKLVAAIEGITGFKPDAAGLKRARQLFAAAIETPGGLKILTIHAFCERVLHLFPFEANVPAQFAVLDDRAARELLDAARTSLILEANAQPEGSLGRAMARLLEDTGEGAFDGLLAEITFEREALRPFLSEKGAADALDQLRGLLELKEGESVAAIEAEIDEASIPFGEWAAIEASLREYDGKRILELADRLAAAIAAAPARRAEAWRAVFLTGTGEARSANAFLVKDFTKDYPHYAEQLFAELGRIAELLQRRKAASAYERSAALIAVAAALLGRYKAGKAARAALDFDDLVQRTADLLSRAGAEWVLYKLDRGIDHILVDEAQDTSPAQWHIIEMLAHEFTSGAGARSERRTIFAVGDEKQSIFSFQGAAPAEFARMRSHFRRKVAEAEARFEAIELKQSFRSTPDILLAVDHVFAIADNRRGLSSDDVATVHETVRAGDPGRVEVWPVEKPQPAAEITAWDAPFDETPVSSPVVRLARKIAAEVSSLIRDGDPSTGARYDAGDVMVLVRSRNALFEAVIRALKFAGVPVAGADRIVLTDHIAVMDLMALARFVLLPADDLTLATVLKTPLIGLDDEDLIRLAPGRKGTLWAALGEAAREDERYASAFARLVSWREEAAGKTPFAFFADILARDGGRRIMLARFGAEAADALDEFLRVAGDYERANTASLQGFLAWLAEAKAEIKRDMDVARGEVRVMTVHGSKGLEARVVILADTCSAPDGRHDPKLFFLQAQGTTIDRHRSNIVPILLETDASFQFEGIGKHYGRPAGSSIPVWSPSKASDPPPVAAARDAIRAENEAEHRRLLYVALTRAEDRLIIAGFEGATARRPGNWYDMIADALRERGARVEPDGEGERLVYEPTPRRAVEGRPAKDQAAAVPTPAWLRQKAAPERAEEVALSPSETEHPEELAGLVDTLPADSRTLRRGALIHALLQYLPDVEPPARRDQALAFLARAAAEWPEDHQVWAEEALAVLALPSLEPLFAAGSRAEVALTGRITRQGRADYAVSGRIDRLAVGPDTVWIVDFKTNRRPPQALEAVPQAYLSQLGLYRHLLKRLYPGKEVRVALVWTATAALMELPAERLEEAVRAVVG